MLLLLLIVITTLFGLTHQVVHDNVGKLFIGRGCEQANLFGIAAVVSSSNLGFLELPRIYGECYTEEQYDEWWGEDPVPVSSREQCDSSTNIINYSGWFNSTECLDTDPDWTGGHQLGECENSNQTEISTMSWCTHNVIETLPHMVVYDGDGCSEGDIMFHLWVRPNYCIYVHFDHDDDTPISFIVIQDGNTLSPRQYNSTDCDEETEIWRADYSVGECNVASNLTRRTSGGGGGISGSLGTHNVMWVSAVAVSGLVISTVASIVITLLVVAFVVVAVIVLIRDFRRK